MLVAAAAAGPPPSRHPTCGEKAAPAKALHGSLRCHASLWVLACAILQHIINPVPQSDGMYPAVCAVRIFSLCCLSGMLPFLSA